MLQKLDLKNNRRAIFWIAPILFVVITASTALPRINSLKTVFEKSKVEQTKNWCLRLGDSYKRQQCLQPYFTQLTLDKGAAVAMNEAVNLKNQGYLVPCHIAAHYIGNANLERNNNDVAKAIVSCPLNCAEGCVHGVMEKYASKLGSYTEAIEQASKLCSSFKDNQPVMRQCYHGLGHGIMAHQNTSITDGLETCAKVSDSYYSWVCQDGAMMEYMIDKLPSEPEALKTVLPGICQPVIDKNNPTLTDTCFAEMGTVLDFIAGNNLQRAQSFCDYFTDAWKIKSCKDQVAFGVDINNQF